MAYSWDVQSQRTFEHASKLPVEVIATANVDLAERHRRIIDAYEGS